MTIRQFSYSVYTFCFLAFVGSQAFAESPSPETTPESPNWTLQVDPLTTYLGYVHLQVERKLSDHASFYAGPHLRLFTPPHDDPEDYIGIGIEWGARFYPSGTAPEGWWFLFRSVGANIFTDDESRLGGYASLLSGYTWIWNWFVLSAGGGVQYIHYTVDDLGPTGIFPALHTALGIAF